MEPNYAPNLRNENSLLSKISNSQEKKPKGTSSMGREYNAYFMGPKSNDKTFFVYRNKR